MSKTKAGLGCSFSESGHEATSCHNAIFIHSKAQEIWYPKEDSQEEKNDTPISSSVINPVILLLMIIILTFKLCQNTFSSAIHTVVADERPLKSLADAANEVSF